MVVVIRDRRVLLPGSARGSIKHQKKAEVRSQIEEVKPKPEGSILAVVKP
jgi:hypothetical protein